MSIRFIFCLLAFLWINWGSIIPYNSHLTTRNTLATPSQQLGNHSRGVLDITHISLREMYNVQFTLIFHHAIVNMVHWTTKTWIYQNYKLEPSLSSVHLLETLIWSQSQCPKLLFIQKASQPEFHVPEFWSQLRPICVIWL